MDSLCDHVHKALHEFEVKFAEQRDHYVVAPGTEEPIEKVRAFEKDFRLLKYFHDCTLMWREAVQLKPHMEKVGSKIEAVILQVGTHILKVIPKETKRCSHIFLRHHNLSVAASNAISVLTDSIVDIKDLKAEIRGLYTEILLMSESDILVEDASLKLKVYADWEKLVYAHWEKLVKIEQVIENLLDDNTSLKVVTQKHIRRNLARVLCFIERLINTGPRNSEAKSIMVHIGRTVNVAAFVCFEAWLWPKDQTILQHMSIKIQDLRQDTDLSSCTVLVDQLLALLQSYSGISKDGALTQVTEFVKEFCGFVYGSSPFGIAVEVEMVSLLRHFFNSPDDAQFFWPDVRKLVMKATSFKYNSSTNRNSMRAKFLVNICLIKKDMFLMRRISAGEMVSNVKNDLLPNSHNLDEYVSEWIRDENAIQILKLIQKFTSDLSNLQDLEWNMVKSVLYKFLSKILLTRAELYLEELIKENETLTELDTDGINSLLEGLKLLTVIVENLSENRVNSKILEGIRTLARELCSLYSLFPDDKIPETKTKDVNSSISGSGKRFKVIMADFKRICLDITIFTIFPATNKIRLVDSLLSDIQQLLILKEDVILDAKHNIKEVGRNLELLKSFLARVDEQNIAPQKQNILKKRVMALAQEMQYFVDRIPLRNTPMWMIKVWIYSIQEDFRLVTGSVTKIHEKETIDPGLPINSSIPLQMETPLDSTSRVDQVVVRLEDQHELIIDRLTLGTPRDVVSIVGMAGIGKTTLALEVYNSPKIVYHFHVRAWCNISQKYRKRELVLDLLSHTIGLNDSFLQMSDGDLELKLYQSLKQRRYLIVMDDLWDAGAWDELVRALPNDRNGSRILITSRILEVVKGINPTSDPHLMRLLSDDESWDLFQMKAGTCPADLVETGKLIAHNCGGLPLAVVAIAGLMERSRKTQTLWIQIAENLRSRILDDPQTRCAYILGLSYKHLPDSLKECFLYFGAFEGGIDIPVRKLIWLWIAEGFIPKNASKSFEDIAEEYLMDLVGRSLVIVADKRSLGGIKACRLHDLLHELCHSIGTQDKFINRVIGNVELDDASFNDLDYGVDSIPNDQFRTVRYEDHRLSIFSKRKHFVSSRPSGPRVHSLLFIGVSDAYPRCPYDVTFITSNFKLLKVLDLESINMGHSFPKGLELLIHLRYLAVCGDIDLVPSSIDKLVKLQTLIIRGLKGQVVLPYTIWSMSSLRHLHVKSRALIDFGDGNLDDLPQLDNLVTLSLLFIYFGDDKMNHYRKKRTNKLIILSRLPHLRKLSCVLAESPNQSIGSKSSLSLDYLIELVSLKISYIGKALTPCLLHFPSNLRKLTLSNFRLPWDRISVIGILQNLVVLKLLYRAFEGENWDMVEGEFIKLNYLKLEGLNIVKWNVWEEHLPSLQVLVLQNCRDLEELSPSFTCIDTLQLIEVKHCGSSLEESVRNIDEEGIRVLIHSSNMEPTS